MKRLIIPLMSLFLACMMWSCSDDDDTDVAISYDQLPTAAKTFLAEYFAGDEVVRIEKDSKDDGSEYDVKFKSGADVEFDAAGQWVSVDAPFGVAVPSGIVPVEISNYVQTNYPESYISEISRGYPAWEIELSNGVDVQFSSTFEVIWIGQ